MSDWPLLSQPTASEPLARVNSVPSKSRLKTNGQHGPSTQEQPAPGDKAGKVREFLWVSSKNLFCRQLLYDVDVSFHYPIYHIQFMLFYYFFKAFLSPFKLALKRRHIKKILSYYHNYRWLYRYKKNSTHFRGPKSAANHTSSFQLFCDTEENVWEFSRQI